jgi:hypothetical protein
MSEPTLPPPSEEDARRHRQEALRNLAQNQSASPPAATPRTATSGASRPQLERTRPRAFAQASPRRHRQPPCLIVVSAVIVLVVVAGVILHQLGTSPGRSTGSKTATTVVTIVASLHGLDCIQDAAWSPNAQQVPLLGYGGQCPSDDPSSYMYQPGVLQIYSVVTGQLLHTILPDATVHALPDSPASPADVNPGTTISGTSKTVLVYTHVLWSPDGSKLALTFAIMTWPGQGNIPVPAFRGIVLVNADGTHEHAAILRETGQQDSYFLLTALRWDTTSLSSLTATVRQSYGPLISMPLGNGYSWSPDDHLIPAGSLTSASSPTGPVGDPDGGNAFTIWQPAIIELFAEPEAPYVYTWYSSFLAWSPDGRYLIDSVSLRGVVHPVGEPIPTAGELDEVVGPLTPPTMPIRDTAQQQLYVLLTKIAAGGNKLFGDIAWNPTGRILAAISDNGSSDATSGSASSPPVTLYDSATGKSLGTLQPPAVTHASANGSSSSSDINLISLLRWSADGSHLLVYSDQTGIITIWGPSMLPHGT